MKRIALLCMTLCLFSVAVQAQVLATRNGKISFASPSDDDVKAVNNQVTSRLATATGQMTFSVLMKGFKFELAEMQDHFNGKDYANTTTYPRADFSGMITNVKTINFTKDGTYAATVKGNLTMHGVTKSVTVTGNVIVAGGKVTVKASFPLALADYNINGKGVSSKINVEVSCKYD